MRTGPPPRLRIAAFVALCAAAHACSQSNGAAPSTSADAGAGDATGDVELAEAHNATACWSFCGARSASGSSSGPYTCDPSGACVQCVSDPICFAAFGALRPVCLPNETCGCTQDSQCTGRDPPPPSGPSQPRELVGPGTRCVTPLHECGCFASADCPDPRMPACDPASSLCVECLTGANCTDPDRRACPATTCQSCFTSSDCATSGDGPTCFNNELCTCASDSDCVGRGEGPSCVADTAWPYKKCSCHGPADCASSAEGHACVNQLTLVYVAQGFLPSYNTSGWSQCGCATDADCPAGTACQTQVAPQYRCRPVPSDGGVSESGSPDAHPD